MPAANAQRGGRPDRGLSDTLHEHMIEVDSVHKAFGRIRAVRGVSFDLAPGKVTGLLGPNGAGKSTTIRMIAGSVPPDRGGIRVFGHDTIDQGEESRRRLGYLPESAPLYPEMTPLEYLHFRGRLYGMDTKGRRAAAAAVLERCHLNEVARRRIGTLSKGTKQRVGLAGALLHNPPALILDEPTNGLDPTQIHEARRFIRELGLGRIVLISSHILTEIERMCDRVLVMAGGELKADATPRDLAARSIAGATYVVQIRRDKPGDDERALRLLRNLPFVQDLQPNTADRSTLISGWSVWVVTAKDGAPDLRESIAQGCMQQGLLVRELRKETASLEKAFLKLVEGTEETPAVAAQTIKAREESTL
jgi:ABC-2 type transport system ATP-binding protein